MGLIRHAALAVAATLLVATTPAHATPPPSSPQPSTALLGAVPTIDGDARVGSSVTAVIGAWTPGAVLSFQWYADGVPVPGAVLTTFAPEAAQQGKVLKIVVTGTLGGEVLSRSSSGTRPVARGTLPSTRPTIRGKPVVGRTLTARAGEWPSGTLLEHQWLVGGRAVAKRGTGRTLHLTAAMRGKRVVVRLTASLPGYQPRTVTSRRTRQVTSRR